MRGITKQLSLLTAIVLLVSVLVTTASAAPVEDCPGSCTHTAAVDTIHYDTLEDAVAAAPEGSTVTLLVDTILAETLPLAKTVSLDLGGKILTGSVDFQAGGSVKNGKIIAVDAPAVTVSGCAVTIEKDAHLEGCGTEPTLLITAEKDKDADVDVSGTLIGKGPAPVIEVAAEEGNCQLNILKNAQLTAEKNVVIAFDSAGKLEISGGTIQGKKDLIALQINKNRKTDIAITGGKLLTEDGEVVVINAQEGAEVPKDFITGGTFKKIPAPYVPNFCKPQDNGDGTVTIRSSYTVTFLSGGASGTMEPVKVKCGTSFKLPACGFTPAEGMDFAGWDIDGKTYAAGASFTPEGDVTVTAQWKAHTHYGGNATCMKKAVCTGCGKTYGKLGSHKLSYNGGYAATCSTTGMSEHSKCGICGSCFVNGTAVSPSDLSTAALGHNWESKDGKDASCEEEGLHPHRLCTVCSLIQLDGKDVDADAVVIPATGHTLEAVAATESACTMPGIQAHEHCTGCDGLFLKGKAVVLSDLTTALASHVLSEEWYQDEIYHWKNCVSCSEVFRQNRHVDADADGSCDDCAYTMEVQDAPAEETASGFPWYVLIPVVLAAVIFPIAKKRKNA